MTYREAVEKILTHWLGPSLAAAYTAKFPEPVADLTIDTAGFDKAYPFTPRYNPVWFDKLTGVEQLGVVEHELRHMLAALEGWQPTIRRLSEIPFTSEPAPEPCCESMRKALDTDDDGVAWVDYHGQPARLFFSNYEGGTNEEPLRFCPWCGKPVPEPEKA